MTLFGYYFGLALRSLRRYPVLTSLMVLAIGFGVAASMTTWSVFRAVSGDPIPWKSSKLFVPQIDMWGPNGGNPDNAGEPPDALDYGSAVALMRDHRATLQSAMYMIAPSVVSSRAGAHPLNVVGHAVYSEFFPMLNTPFLYGGGWSAADDAHRAPVIVISSDLNRKLFGGKNSVGKTLEIEGKQYTVVGVLDNWHPQPRFYDLVDTGGFNANQEALFLPFQTAIAAGIETTGNTNCSIQPEEAGFTGLQRSSCVWITYMAQLDDAAAVHNYKAYLDGFARQRYAWPANTRLSNLPHWLDHMHVVPSDTKVSTLVGFGLLLVSLVNTAGLLLAKFMRRSGDIGVRRALGASRKDIYVQFLTEAGIVGVAGGAVGLLLTGLGVVVIRAVLPSGVAALARIDVSLLLTTLIIAVVASLLAGLYPAFRAAHVQPARALKSN